MASETEADVPAVQDAARDLARSTGDFKETVESVLAALERDEGCWSDDEMGKAFEKNYKKYLSDVTKGLQDTSKSLDELANKGLPQAVESIQKLDSSYGKEFDKFAEQIDDYKPASDGLGEQTG